MAYAVRRLTQEKVDKAIKSIDASRKAGQHIKSQLLADGGGLYLKLPQASYTSSAALRRAAHLTRTRIGAINQAGGRA